MSDPISVLFSPPEVFPCFAHYFIYSEVTITEPCDLEAVVPPAIDFVTHELIQKSEESFPGTRLACALLHIGNDRSTTADNRFLSDMATDSDRRGRIIRYINGGQRQDTYPIVYHVTLVIRFA